MKKKRNFNYPEETKGSKIAREIRKESQKAFLKMSEEELGKFLKKGLKIIFKNG